MRVRIDDGQNIIRNVTDGLKKWLRIVDYRVESTESYKRNNAFSVFFNKLSSVIKVVK